MAKIITSAIVEQLIGSIGSNTFRRSQFGSVVYNKQTPLKRASEIQISHRALIGRLRANWSQMTDIRRASWFQLALQLQSQNIGNGQFPKRPYDLFLEFNYLRFAYDGGFSTLAPAAGVAFLVNDFTGIWNDDGTTSYSFSNSPAAQTLLQQVSARVGLRSNQRSAFTPWKVVLLDRHTTYGGNFDSGMLEFFGLPTIGQIYQLKFSVQRSNTFPRKFLSPVQTVV